MRSRRWDGKSGCAVEVTLSVMGGVWKPIILFHLMTGKRRFMELTRRVPNATQSMLTSQLRELEADGVVIRHVYPEVPPKVEYELSNSVARWCRCCLPCASGVKPIAAIKARTATAETWSGVPKQYPQYCRQRMWRAAWFHEGLRCGSCSVDARLPIVALEPCNGMPMHVMSPAGV